MAQVPGEVDNMEGLPALNNNNPSARWESPDRGWEREPTAASTAAASLFECSRIKALAGTWRKAGWAEGSGGGCWGGLSAS
jgi:spectrin beta